MDIRKYEVFLRAVDRGSLTRAGEELGYTQSGVSHMIKALETEMGFPLLLRHRNGVSPTAAGERVMPILWELVNAQERLNQVGAAILGLEVGNLRIGAFYSVSRVWLPRVLKQFETEHPGIEVEIVEGGSDTIEAGLVNGRLDLGFFSWQPHFTFDWIHLTYDHLMGVLPQDHPLTARKELPAEALAGEPFIMLSTGVEQDIPRYLREVGVEPRVKFSSNNDYAVVAMVESGLGITVVPELVLEGASNRVAALPMVPEYKRDLGIAVRSGAAPSPAMEKFIDCTRRVLLPQ